MRDLDWGQVVQCLMRIMDHPKVGENGMENDQEQAIRMANALFGEDKLISNSHERGPTGCPFE